MQDLSTHNVREIKSTKHSKYKLAVLSVNDQSDFISMLPLPQTVSEDEPYELIFALQSFDSNIVTAEVVQEHTNCDNKSALRKSLTVIYQKLNL